MRSMKSGLVYPENRWLVADPGLRPGNFVMTHTEFFAPVGHWALDSGLQVEATAGAFLGFDFSGHPEALLPTDEEPAANHLSLAISAMRQRAQVINAFALCLHSATIELDNITYGGFRITHEELVHYDDLMQGYGGPGSARLPVVPGLGYLLTPSIRNGACSAEAIHKACAQLDQVLQSRHPKALTLVALTNHALNACRGHDFELAIATAWTACESLLDSLWDEYARSQAAQQSLEVTKKRRDHWAGRDFTASIIVEVMTLAGVISPQLSTGIGAVRSKRNRWIHGVATASYQDAIDAVNLARDLLDKVLHLDFKVAPAVGVSY